MTWLLCDYGEVLCLPQPPAAVEAMAGLCDMATGTFTTAYWSARPGYDSGDLDARDYWGQVLGADPGGRLGALVEADVEGWLHLDHAALSAVARAVERGMRPAILSNAPHEVARAVDALPELATFSPRLFSCDLGVVKPDPAIYRLVVARLGPDIVFVDDRPANVEAARAEGITALVCSDPGCIDGV